MQALSGCLQYVLQGSFFFGDYSVFSSKDCSFAHRGVSVSAGAILLGSGVVGGYCVYGLASFLYYAIYPPVRIPRPCCTSYFACLQSHTPCDQQNSPCMGLCASGRRHWSHCMPGYRRRDDALAMDVWELRCCQLQT